MERTQVIYKALNGTTPRFSVVSETEIVKHVGETVIKMWWVESIQRYCTIPGASIYKVSPSHELVLDDTE